MENLEKKIGEIEGVNKEDIEYYEAVLKRKQRTTNPEPKIYEKEKILLEFNANLETIPHKEVKKKRSKESWTEFLSEEESKRLLHLDPSSEEYRRMRGNCYTRRYYSDPENLKLQYARNKKYSIEKRIEKSEELKKNMAFILEERKKKLEERRLKANEKSRAYYHKMKSDPEFKMKEKERNEKYRGEHRGYRKINYKLHKNGALPMSEKSLARKEEIKKILTGYELLADFKRDYPLEYNFINSYGIKDEMFSGLYDYDVKEMKKTLSKEGLLTLSAKDLERKDSIREKLKNYRFLSDFRKDHINDYQWISKNGLGEELYYNLYDYNRRRKNVEEREDINDPDIKMFRKCRRNADKCQTLDEFKARFASSYEFAVSKNIVDEIEKLIKK